MFCFDSNGQFCIGIQDRVLFKINFLFPGDNVSKKCVQCQRISLLFRKSAVLENFLSIIGQFGANHSFYMISLDPKMFFNHFPTIFIRKN